MNPEFRLWPCLPLLVLLIAAPFGLSAQDEVSDIRYQSSHVAGNIYLLNDPKLSAADNVIVSAGSDGLLMVDDAFMETLNSVRPLVNDLGGSVKILINTHFHHAGANESFAPGAMVIAHRNVRKRMQLETRMYGQFPIGPWPEPALPDITFDSTLTLHFNGEEIRIVHLPNAHTDGDAVVFFTGSNVVATGDVFVPSLGVCDHQNGGIWGAYLHSIDLLLKRIPKDAAIVPGHGPVSSYEDLEEAREMLHDVTDMVREKINEGRTRENIVSEGLPAQWESWSERGLPANFFLTNVYRGLTGK